MSKAKIIGVTSPRIEGLTSAGDLIAYAARVSNPSNQMNSETAPKLLKYLATHEHWSPFEMVHVVMEINTTRDIARQILRHRSFSFQEFSQRYATVESLGFETREARLQDLKNRQNSIDVSDEELQLEWQNAQSDVIDLITEVYGWALENGIAKEQARAVLPEGLTRSRMYMSGSVRSWIHYIQLRRQEGTQKEHREIALDAQAEILKEFPSLEGIL